MSLTAAQNAFVSRLAGDTGLDPGVISAWAQAEESGSAALARQNAGNNDWLNIGYTDSGTFGAGATVWANPISAADATAGWLKGKQTVPGYGAAAPGIQAILSTAGQSPGTQIQAIQKSGWASSGYPSLPSIYSQAAKTAPAASAVTGAAGVTTIPGSSSYGGLGGFLLKAVLTVALLLGGLWLAFEGFNGVLGGRPARAGKTAAAAAVLA